MSEDNLHCRSVYNTAQKCNLTTRNQDNVMKSFYSKLKNFAIFTTLLFIALFFLPDYVLGNQIISYGAILFVSMFIVLMFFYFIGLEKTKTTSFLLDSTDINYSLFSSTSFSDVNRSIISVTSIISMVVSFFILVAYIIRRRNFYEISTKLQNTKDPKKELFTATEKDGKKEWSPKSKTFEDMDTNKDGIISKKEFVDWYRKNVQGGANDAQEDENIDEEEKVNYFPGGPPQNIFQLGQDQILLISTIPIITMAIRYNLENNFIKKIWSNEDLDWVGDLEKIYGPPGGKKHMPASRKDLYKRLLKKGYNFGLFIDKAKVPYPPILKPVQ